MITKEQVQKAIKEIDDNLALLNGPRQAHLVLANDMRIVQDVCMLYFDIGEIKNVGTDKPIDPASVINKDK